MISGTRFVVVNAWVMIRVSMAAFIAAACLVAASPAQAQSASADSSSDMTALAKKLKAGEQVVVTTQDGAEVQGRFADASATGLSLQSNGARQQLPAGQVRRVQVRRNGILLGAVIGAGAGAALGLALMSAAQNEGGNEATAFALPLAAGAGAGIAIDALLVKPRTVFERQPAVRTTLLPLVSPNMIGARAGISF